MTFSSEVHDRIDVLVPHRFKDSRLVANIELVEPVFGMACQIAEGLQVARVGQLIDVHYAITTGNKVTANGASYEPGAPGNQNTLD